MTEKWLGRLEVVELDSPSVDNLKIWRFSSLGIYPSKQRLYISNSTLLHSFFAVYVQVIQVFGRLAAGLSAP